MVSLSMPAEMQSKNIRKISSGLRVFRLLLGQKSGEGDDIGVDGFVAHGRRPVSV